jgi:hypothetical protein
MSLKGLLSRIHQLIVNLEALQAILQDCGPAAFPPPARDLARVEDALAWIAEGLGVGCDPLAAGR